jgi:hypothetical protein
MPRSLNELFADLKRARGPECVGMPSQAKTIRYITWDMPSFLYGVLWFLTNPRHLCIKSGDVDEGIPIINEQSVTPSPGGQFCNQLGKSRQMVRFRRVSAHKDRLPIRKEGVRRIRGINRAEA